MFINIKFIDFSIASEALAVFVRRSNGVKLEIRAANILHYLVFLRCLGNAKFPLVDSDFD
jgi:hypothetical protein